MEIALARSFYKTQQPHCNSLSKAVHWFSMLVYSGAWALLIEDPRSVYFAANLTYPFAPDGQRTILLLCSLRASCTELRALVRLCLRELLILLGLLHRDAPLPAPREALRLVQVPSQSLE